MFSQEHFSNLNACQYNNSITTPTGLYLYSEKTDKSKTDFKFIQKLNHLKLRNIAVSVLLLTFNFF